jgi:hypothetical protein
VYLELNGQSQNVTQQRIEMNTRVSARDALQIALEHPTAQVVWSRALEVFGDKATALDPMTMSKQGVGRIGATG